MEYYAAMKRSEVLTLATTWVDLEHTVLGERSQTQRPYNVWFHVNCQEQANPDTKSGSVVCQRLRRGRGKGRGRGVMECSGIS